MHAKNHEWITGRAASPGPPLPHARNRVGPGPGLEARLPGPNTEHRAPKTGPPPPPHARDLPQDRACEGFANECTRRITNGSRVGQHLRGRRLRLPGIASAWARDSRLARTEHRKPSTENRPPRRHRMPGICCRTELTRDLPANRSERRERRWTRCKPSPQGDRAWGARESNAGWRIRDTGYGIRDTGCRMSDVG